MKAVLNLKAIMLVLLLILHLVVY